MMEGYHLALFVLGGCNLSRRIVLLWASFLWDRRQALYSADSGDLRITPMRLLCRRCVELCRPMDIRFTVIRWQSGSASGALTGQVQDPHLRVQCFCCIVNGIKLWALMSKDCTVMQT